MSVLSRDAHDRAAARRCAAPPPIGTPRRRRRDRAPARGLRAVARACCWSPTGGRPAAASRTSAAGRPGSTSLGRLTGLVASVLLLVQVLLMARRAACWSAAFGQDRLARAAPAGRLHLVQPDARPHRPDHLGLRRRASSSRRPATLWDLIVDYPGMLLAAGRHGLPGHGRGHQHQGRPAPAALRVLAPAAPLRLPRRRPGAAAPAVDRPGVPRPRPAAPSSGGRPGRVAAGAVLVWRVGLPLWRNLRHRLRVTSVVPRGRRRRVGLPDRPRGCDRLRVEAGQFFTWRFLAGPGWTRANPYSLSAAPDGRSLRITVKAVGDGSAALRRAAARHPGAGRGALRPAQPPGPAPAARWR